MWKLEYSKFNIFQKLSRSKTRGVIVELFREFHFEHNNGGGHQGHSSETAENSLLTITTMSLEMVLKAYIK